jgi:hypothetical protein
MQARTLLNRNIDQKRYGIKSSYKCKNDHKIHVRPYSAIVMAI